MPSVDVLIPCYQYGRFLGDSVGSVLWQGVEELRVLIIDNASTDDSLEIARELARKDHRISVVAHKTNLGQQVSYNEGLEWASADYFIIVDADDILPKGSLFRSVSIMEENPDVVLAHGVEVQKEFSMRALPNEAYQDYPNVWEIYSGDQFISDVTARYKFVGATTVLRRTVAQKQAGYYNEHLNYSFDSNMWLRLALLGRIAETTSVQGIRRLHPSQITEFYRKNPLHDCIERFNNFDHFFQMDGSALPDAKSRRRQMHKAVAVSALWTGIALYRDGNEEDAASCVQLGLHMCPSAILPRIAKQIVRKRLPARHFLKWLRRG